MSPQLISLMVGNDHAVPLSPQGGTATVTVDQTGGTVFYADNPQVSASNNQGSIAPGGQGTFTSPVWLRGSSTAGVQVSISSVYANWALQSPGVVIPAPSTVHAFGHSYISGAMSNASANRQTAKFAAASHATETNKGVGSSILCTQTGAGGIDTSTGTAGIVGLLQAVTAARTPGTDPFLAPLQCAVLCWGINDWALMGSAQFAVSFPANLHTAIRRLRAGAVFEDSDASVTFPTGTWGSGAGTTANSGAGNHATTTNGTAVIAVPSQYQGQAITIGQIDVGQPNTCVVTDETGRTVGSLVNNGFSFTQTVRRNGYPSIYLPAGTLSPGSHTLTCTYTLAGTNAFFDYWQIESNPTPLILIQLANRIPNWSLHASGWPNAPLNDAAVTTMNSIMQGVASAYPDGRVICVAVDDLIDNQTYMLTVDGVHPNSNTAGLMAQRFYQTMALANQGRGDLLQLGTT